ncbi:MAG: Maf family protein [Planctomycetota bacterium]|jgi:septum formation protein
MRIILASASPRRARLLAEAGVQADVIPSHVPEEIEIPLDPTELAGAVAERKCDAVAARYHDALVIAADTLVVAKGRALGKPKDLADARRMLRSLSGQSHSVVTAVALEHRREGKKTSFTEESRVLFKDLEEEEIEAYLAAVHVLDKAGAYAIQERPDLLGAHVEGSFSNVVGLPVKRVIPALRNMGWPGPPKES